MLFLDRAKIFLRAGKGGDGCVSFRREKFVPRGGPDGGDGGEGGSIYLKCSPNISTLIDFTYKPYFKAKNGSPGRGKNQKGKKGDDLIIEVPLGTVVFKNGKFFADLTREDETVMIAAGGMGGRGNAHLKDKDNRFPRFAEKGEPGEVAEVTLELKLIADVGIIGYPNAGKSTLLSRLTSAKPKIADYPFTTKSPNLGVVKYDNKSFVMVDIPGLIEGAHKGRGMGIDFLRHIERTKCLIHLVDVNGFKGRDAFENYLSTNDELKHYLPQILKKPTLIALNKIDIPGSKDQVRKFISNYENNFKRKPNYLAISSLTGEGLKELINKILYMLSTIKIEELKEEEFRRYIIEPEFRIRKLGEHKFVVEGKMIERIVKMTDFSNEEAIKRLMKELKKIGLEKHLIRKGIKSGDSVRISNWEFTYEADSN